MCSVIFPKHFNYKAPGKATAPSDCRPRAWHRALTTGSQVAAKDLVDQCRCLGLAVQPRDSSTGSHTVPALWPPRGHHGVLSTNPWLELRAGHCRGNAASRGKGPGTQVLPGEHADPTVPSSKAEDQQEHSGEEQGQPIRETPHVPSAATQAGLLHSVDGITQEFMRILLLTEAHVPSDLCRTGRNQPQRVL